MKKHVTNVKLIDFEDALTILFITLKLCGVIDWSWWWVLSPTLIPTSIGLVFVAGIFLICGVVSAKEKLEYFDLGNKIKKISKIKEKISKKQKNSVIKKEVGTATDEINVEKKEEILEQHYKFQNLSIREKIEYLESEKEKLLNMQNNIDEKQEDFQKYTDEDFQKYKGLKW